MENLEDEISFVKIHHTMFNETSTVLEIEQHVKEQIKQRQET
jgi:hypothetical protein